MASSGAAWSEAAPESVTYPKALDCHAGVAVVLLTKPVERVSRR
jgi:hypothetical protein